MGKVETRKRVRINPFTDYGFKKFFGTEPNKDLLIDFINSVLKGERIVTDVSFTNSERVPDNINGKTIFIDILCHGADGSIFVVEMQRIIRRNLLQRLLYYGCRLIAEQLMKGDEYDLKPVYVICLLEEIIPDNLNLRSNYTIIREPDMIKELNELRIILFQLARFTKRPNECLSFTDKWLYLLKNLEYMERLPKELQNTLAEKLMDISRIEAMSQEEREAYEKSMMEYVEIKEYTEYARAEGKIEGRKEGKIEGEKEGISKTHASVIGSMRKAGLSDETIASYTGIPLAEVVKY